MPRTLITQHSVALATPFSQDQTSQASMIAVDGANGMYFVNTNGRVCLYVKNNSSDALLVTVITPKTVVGLAVADVPITVAANDEAIIGPFDADTFHQSGGTNINVDFAESGGTGALAGSKVRAIKVTPASS